jgi:hypothetical protein
MGYAAGFKNGTSKALEHISKLIESATEDYRQDEITFLEALALSVTKVIIGQKPISDLSWEIYSRTAKLLLERKILNEQALKEEQYENPKERNCGGS